MASVKQRRRRLSWAELRHSSTARSPPISFCAVTFLYAVGFVANVVVPNSIDSGGAGRCGRGCASPMALLGLRHPAQRDGAPRFKGWWTRIVPNAVERSTYVAPSSGRLTLLSGMAAEAGLGVWSVASPLVARSLAAASFFAGSGRLLVLGQSRFSSTISTCSGWPRFPYLGDHLGTARRPSTHAAVLSVHPPSALPGLSPHVLGDAGDDARAFALRVGDHGLYLCRHLRSRSAILRRSSATNIGVTASRRRC